MNEWPLGTLQDQRKVCDRLVAEQLSCDAADGKAALFARAAAALESSGVPVTAPAIACFVPGRIEVLGKHTDYAGGRSMVAAAERGFCLVAVASGDQQVLITDVATGESVQFPFTADLQPREGHWSNYPMSVARRVARNFSGPLGGAQIAFASDLPAAAGMSSSSAMVVAEFLALSALNEMPRRREYSQNIHRPEDLAGYLATMENGQSFGDLIGDRGVGTFGGSEDHTAILCARPGQISQYSYCPVCFERTVSLPEGYCFAIAVSGVVAEKTGAAMAKYNRTSQLAAAALDLWNRATSRIDPHLAAAVGSSPDATRRLRDVLDHARHPEFASLELLDRMEQFVAESEQIIPSVADSLDGPALAEFGQSVDRSQSLGARLLKNQVPETIFLADRARRLGAEAASAFGAGFGGSVWALVRHQEASEFCTSWSAAYAETYPQHIERARFETTSAGPPAFFVSGSQLSTPATRVR